MIARPSTTSNPSVSTSPSVNREISFINSKKDRRTIKHSAFISRIEKASKKPLKRRRPNKKLVTTLEGLADALPSVDGLVAEGKGGVVWNGVGKKSGSLKSKPGAMKRKEKLERGERERFGRNLAVIMGSRVEVEEKSMGVEDKRGEGEGAEKQKTELVKGRFAALRAWVGTNMEKHPAFEKGKE
jgi:Ribosome biogenesis protein SLX9